MDCYWIKKRSQPPRCAQGFAQAAPAATSWPAHHRGGSTAEPDAHTAGPAANRPSGRSPLRGPRRQSHGSGACQVIAGARLKSHGLRPRVGAAFSMQPQGAALNGRGCGSRPRSGSGSLRL